MSSDKWEQYVACPVGMWYKTTEDGRGTMDDRSQETEYMEVSELRTAISELLARVERIRDWL